MPLVADKTRQQLGHRWRFARQHVVRPEVGVIGGYHGANLGDLALGRTVEAAVLAAGRSAGLQTIYNLARWPDTPAAILGGGAIAYADSMARVVERFGGRPEAVAIVGVDFNDPVTIERHRHFLSRVARLVCRSSAQARRLQAALPDREVTWELDLAFGAPWMQPRMEVEAAAAGSEAGRGESSQPAAGERLCGISCPPALWCQRGADHFEPGTQFAEEFRQAFPGIRDLVDVAQRYLAMWRQAVRELRARGFRVVHVPFALQDDAFARWALREEDIDFAGYRTDPAVVARRVAACDLFFAGRFHSLVFSLAQRVPCVPFCYAPKSGALLDDLGLATNGSRFDMGTLTRGDWSERLLARLGSPVTLPANVVAERARSVARMVAGTVEAVVP